MKISDFDYILPDDLIAVYPTSPRDHSRLLVLNKNTGAIEHKYFYNIVDYLRSGDVLVMNDSKVIPARLIGKKTTGGRVEIFLHQLTGDNWQCMIGGRGAREGLEIEFDKRELVAKIVKNNKDGTFEISFNKSGNYFWKIVEVLGEVPIPPYIVKNRSSSAEATADKENYQTVYAADDKKGSVAAPTAGLHFTSELLKKIKDMGVQIEYVTLHVGMGTFASVKTENILEHKMHSEFVEIKKKTLERIKEAKKEKRRVISVGTTSTRVLEAVMSTPKSFKLVGDTYSGMVNIFIYPGCEFKLIDAMITNFHLPKSTLLMLVSALAGKKNIKNVYAEAIKKGYRFYSYGDGMLIV